jgi:WD40 repeat protein/mono/diheme cytochrome c family protein
MASMTTSLRIASLFLAALPLAARGDEGAKPGGKVSYYTQVRPIFQAHCQGCHQPAKAGGDYVMTAFDRLLAGGESEEPAVVPKKPAESYLVEQVTPHDGKAAMPKGKPPLTPAELEIIQNWIAQGAVDDTPANAKIRFDKDHPPVYRRPPVIGAIDASPDGKYLAIGGFHEVLLWKADGSELVARLVGLSERIESVRFSPDGTRLAVTGGQPGRMGEVQVWDVAKKSLVLSVPVTFDTIYGASWSPDGSKIALGCADNSVRAIDAKTGAQVLFMGAHNDWVLDTAFSADGSHLMSVGRDMATKLTEVATQRFVDNITSITPGALKGGLSAVARHPKRDEILIGGSDGVPRLYRVFRKTQRVIGDDSNLIREFEPMPGRINAVAVSADGRRIAAASSLDGSGEVDVYGYEFDTGLPDDIKRIMTKISTARKPEEVETLRKYHKDGVKRIAKVDLLRTPVYAIAFAADGKSLAAAGADGLVRIVDTETGKTIKEFAPAPLSQKESPGERIATSATPKSEEPVETETLPKGAKVVALEVQPKAIELKNRFAYTQILVTARLDSGDAIDVTRMVEAKAPGASVEVSRSGQVRPVTDGKTTLTLSLGGLKAEVPVAVSGMGKTPRVDFVHDVAPVLSRLGAGEERVQALAPRV